MYMIELLLHRMPPDCGLMDKPSSGTKGNKKQLTYTLTANTDGRNCDSRRDISSYSRTTSVHISSQIV
jgi:hypothetical protein